MPADSPVTYCWAIDEEEFQGEYPTREAALADALEYAADDGPPYVYTGVAVPPQKMLGQCNALTQRGLMGLVEDIDYAIGEPIGADDPVLTLAPERAAELSGVVLAFLAEHGTWGNRHGVSDVEKHDA